jgi:hypothetical protein
MVTNRFAGRFIESRIYEAVSEAAKKGQAIPGTELYELVYRGLKEKPDWNTFQKHVSNANKRLRADGHIIQSTAAYRLYRVEDLD